MPAATPIVKSARGHNHHGRWGGRQPPPRPNQMVGGSGGAERVSNGAAIGVACDLTDSVKLRRGRRTERAARRNGGASHALG